MKFTMSVDLSWSDPDPGGEKKREYFYRNYAFHHLTYMAMPQHFQERSYPMYPLKTQLGSQAQ